MEKEKNYTEAMEQVIRERAEQGTLNLAAATELATELNRSVRSVIAKIGRMGLDYERKVRQTKSGEKVERKEAIVAEIEALVGETLDGLDKASKVALQRVRNALSA